MKPSKEQVEARMAHFHDTCRRSDLRLTPQRLQVFSELARAQDHPSAEMIHKRVCKRLPTVTLDTVYRTLSTLEQAGLVMRVSVVGGSQRFEANMAKHHHFVCRECGEVSDVYSASLNNVKLDGDLPKGYAVESIQVEIRGICPHCAGNAT